MYQCTQNPGKQTNGPCNIKCPHFRECVRLYEQQKAAENEQLDCLQSLFDFLDGKHIKTAGGDD